MWERAYARASFVLGAAVVIGLMTVALVAKTFNGRIVLQQAERLSARRRRGDSVSKKLCCIWVRL